MLHKHIIALAGILPVVACCILFATASQAQEVPSSIRAVFGDRWAFKTNAFEWFLTIPNFQVEFDLSPSEYSVFLEPQVSFIPYSAISYNHVSTNQNYYDGLVNLGLGVEYDF